MELQWSISVDLNLPVRYACNHLQSLPEMPFDLSLCRSSRYGTLSNAFLKSRYIASTWPLLLVSGMTSSSGIKSCWIVDFPLQIEEWLELITWLKGIQWFYRLSTYKMLYMLLISDLFQLYPMKTRDKLMLFPRSLKILTSACVVSIICHFPNNITSTNHDSI